uniref:Uncharacterized protein MANES_13G154300 n=1 Tax=Rhizophora mucronata TaxID=61149 RepID=A0A2P2K0A0_RHIMU
MILEMIMVNDVRVGVKVFNTYGLMGNAALLHRYGFTEADNPYDIVNIDLVLVLQWSLTLFSNRNGRARLALWLRLGYTECVSRNAEYFEISPDGELQVELLILLYIILLKEDAFYDLDLMVLTANNFNGSISMILSAKCSLTRDESSEISRDLLLTESVCCALLWLADERESAYGLSLADDDIKAMKSCMNDRKLFNSLVLRVSEKRFSKN